MRFKHKRLRDLTRTELQYFYYAIDQFTKNEISLEEFRSMVNMSPEEIAEISEIADERKAQ